MSSCVFCVCFTSRRWLDSQKPYCRVCRLSPKHPLYWHWSGQSFAARYSKEADLQIRHCNFYVKKIAARNHVSWFGLVLAAGSVQWGIIDAAAVLALLFRILSGSIFLAISSFSSADGYLLITFSSGRDTHRSVLGILMCQFVFMDQPKSLHHIYLHLETMLYNCW